MTYQNLKGTYTGYQRQRQQDAIAEQWRGVKLAARAMGTEAHAEDVRNEMTGRLTAAFMEIDYPEDCIDNGVNYCPCANCNQPWPMLDDGV